MKYINLKSCHTCENRLRPVYEMKIGFYSSDQYLLYKIVRIPIDANKSNFIIMIMVEWCQK